MKNILILVGNIGSGKSTLTKKYVKKGYIVISRDSLRYMIGSGIYTFDIKLEPFIQKATILILKTFLQSGYNIIYDETNVSKELRKPVINLAKKYGYKTVAVCLPRLSQKDSVERRMRNNHGQTDEKTWNLVWTRFNCLYEQPTKKEGFDEIIQQKENRDIMKNKTFWNRVKKCKREFKKFPKRMQQIVINAETCATGKFIRK